MAAVNYLPLSEVSKVVPFVQWASPQTTTTLLATALNTAFGATAGSIQVFADGQNAGNALVISNDSTVMTVPANSWISYVQGAWIQITPAQLTAGYTQYFTS